MSSRPVGHFSLRLMADGLWSEYFTTTLYMIAFVHEDLDVSGKCRKLHKEKKCVQ